MFLGRTGRSHAGTAMAFYLEETDFGFASTLIQIIDAAGQEYHRCLERNVRQEDYIYEQRAPNNGQILANRTIQDSNADDDWD